MLGYMLNGFSSNVLYALNPTGNIHVYKSRRAWRSPKLMCVSPLAVVGGQEISLTLRGTNLNFPGTKYVDFIPIDKFFT